jgi:hypothetical protein
VEAPVPAGVAAARAVSDQLQDLADDVRSSANTRGSTKAPKAVARSRASDRRLWTSSSRRPSSPECKKVKLVMPDSGAMRRPPFGSRGGGPNPPPLLCGYGSRKV